MDARFQHPDDDFEKLLAHAEEECAEFLAAAAKMRRWGPLSVNPLLPESEQETNIAWVYREMFDVAKTQLRLRQCMIDKGMVQP
jgi:hypothetical protein